MMRDTRIGSGRMFGDELDQLTSDLRQRPASSPESTLEDVCSSLSRISPLSSAGIFRTSQFASALEWMHISNPKTDFMNQALDTYRDALNSVLDAGRSIQFGEPISGRDAGLYFTGVPAGQFDGAPLGLGVSSDRELHEDELGRLGPFGWLVGLIAENSRLNSLIGSNEDSSSTARLIGFIAHELRTPLTGIRGNIQLSLMSNRKGQHDRIPGRLEAAINGVDSMSAMVQKLLDVSRLERGAFQINVSRSPLGPTVGAAIDDVSAEPESDIPPVRIDDRSSVSIDHDQAALQRAIGNLIRSVANQTGHESEIEFSITDEDTMVRMQISYRGTRLPDEDLQALDVPLSQTRASHERADFLALDLAFTRGVVQRHNGQIVIHSADSSPGQHEIEVRLPRMMD